VSLCPRSDAGGDLLRGWMPQGCAIQLTDAHDEPVQVDTGSIVEPDESFQLTAACVANRLQVRAMGSPVAFDRQGADRPMIVVSQLLDPVAKGRLLLRRHRANVAWTNG